MFDSHIILPQCTNMYTIRLATTHYDITGKVGLQLLESQGNKHIIIIFFK